MKDIVTMLFFPIGYPLLAVVHAIYGGIIYAIITQEPSYKTGLIGAGAGILIGFLVWLFVRRRL